MAGLFDQFNNMNPEQTQGLLAAAAQMLQQSGPSRTPTSFGQVLGGGIGAYQGATAEAQRRKQEQEQAQQAAQMRAQQMQMGQFDLAQRQRGDAEEQAMQGAYREGGNDPQALIDAVSRVNPMKGMELRAKLAKQAPKFDSGIIWVNGADGKPMAMRTADDGSIKQIDGVAPRDKMELANLGGKDLAYNPYGLKDGQTFQRTQTPDSMASTASAAAGRAQSAQQFNERMNHDRQQPRGQIVQTDQGPMLADPRAGTARPLTGPDGQAIGPKMRAVPNQIQKAYMENGSSLRKVQAALDAVEAYPDALGVSNYLGDNIRQRTDPKGVNVRALVADIGSQKIHDRSGAAVTASETPRLKPFIPAATDNPETVAKKLGMFKAEYQAMQTEMEGMYGEDMGYRPLGKSSGDAKPAPAAAPTMAAMPTANASNKGKFLKDHETGKRYQSNGMQWKEVN